MEKKNQIYWVIGIILVIFLIGKFDLFSVTSFGGHTLNGTCESTIPLTTYGATTGECYLFEDTVVYINSVYELGGDNPQCLVDSFGSVDPEHQCKNNEVKTASGIQQICNLDSDCISPKKCVGSICRTVNQTCIPQTCIQANYQCGSWANNCGSQMNCGSCGTNQACVQGQCINNFNPSCTSYCSSQTHIACTGYWSINGTYPNCGCEWKCTQTTPPNNSTNSTVPPVLTDDDTSNKYIWWIAAAIGLLALLYLLLK